MGVRSPRTSSEGIWILQTQPKHLLRKIRKYGDKNWGAKKKEGGGVKDFTFQPLLNVTRCHGHALH